MHRDLKPQNILVSNAKNVEIKLTDFGFATFFDEDEKLDLPLGTPYYLSPEIVKEEKYDQKCDIWSAGVIVYFLLHGSLPFLGVNQATLYNNIANSELDANDPEWEGYSPQAKNFVMKCLTKDPKKRPSAAELLKDPWLNQR